MQKTDNPWSVPVAVDDIPDGGLHREIEPPEPIRAELAELAELRTLPRLSATFDLTRRGAGVRVTGTVRARVGQICGVTLEPMESDVEEAVDLVFAPAPEGVEAVLDGDGKKRRAADDAPDPLVGGKVDLGAIATEFLILGIDPYPRKPGAQFAPPAAENDGTKPFAALEALKKRPGGGQS